MIVSAIVAVAENGVIGDRGAMSWHLKSDFKYFKKNTTPSDHNGAYHL
ncbi:MAG: dihydrofolate reductase [Candidatus Parvibacillus calidus]|nr:MAG: dihydrofolate reductase [Candidatus Parvibacillus calidus]